MRITVAAIVVGLICASSVQGSAQTPAAVDVTPFVAREIVPQIHLLSTPDDFYAFAIGNVLLVEQKDGFVIVDSGMTAAHGRAIVRYARSLSPKPIKAVAITHWHSDHPQGVSAIRDAFPNVRIISTRATEDAILGVASFDIGYQPNEKADAATAERVHVVQQDFQKLLTDPAMPSDRKERVRKAIAQFDNYARDFKGSYLVPPTETFEHRLVLDDPTNPVHLLFLGRANTAGDLVAWLPRQKLVETGDIVVSPWPFGFGSYPADWIETLQKLKALGFSTLVPGHGHTQSDTSYVDMLIAAITEIRAQVGPLAREGLLLEDVKKKVDFTKAGEPFGTTPRDKANFQTLFADPMIDNAYKEALGQPIEQGTPPAGSPQPRFSEKSPPSRAVRHRN